VKKKKAAKKEINAITALKVTIPENIYVYFLAYIRSEIRRVSTIRIPLVSKLEKTEEYIIAELK